MWTVVPILLMSLSLQYAYNPGQNVVNKFTKLSKIDFCMECFTPGFYEFLTKTSKFVFWVGTHHQIQAIQELS